MDSIHLAEYLAENELIDIIPSQPLKQIQLITVDISTHNFKTE